MIADKGTKIFDIGYNPENGKTILTFTSFSDSKPYEMAHIRLNGSYCELVRSDRERLYFKLRNRLMLDALRKAKEIRILETGQENVVWEYQGVCSKT